MTTRAGSGVRGRPSARDTAGAGSGLPASTSERVSCAGARARTRGAGSASATRWTTGMASRSGDVSRADRDPERRAEVGQVVDRGGHPGDIRRSLDQPRGGYRPHDDTRAIPAWHRPPPGEAPHAAAPIVPVLYAALYESIAAHSRAGLHVVVDVGHHDARVFSECARRVAGLAGAPRRDSLSAPGHHGTTRHFTARPVRDRHGRGCRSRASTAVAGSRSRRRVSTTSRSTRPCSVLRSAPR